MGVMDLKGAKGIWDLKGLMEQMDHGDVMVKWVDLEG